MAVIDIKELPISPNRDLKTVIGFDAQNELIKATYTNNGGETPDLSNYATTQYVDEEILKVNNEIGTINDDIDVLEGRIIDLENNGGSSDDGNDVVYFNFDIEDGEFNVNDDFGFKIVAQALKENKIVYVNGGLVTTSYIDDYLTGIIGIVNNNFITIYDARFTNFLQNTVEVTSDGYMIPEEENIDYIYNEIESLNGRVTDLENNGGTGGGDTTELENRVTELENKTFNNTNSLQNQIYALDSRTVTVENDVNTLENNVLSLGNTLANNTSSRYLFKDENYTISSRNITNAKSDLAAGKRVVLNNYFSNSETLFDVIGYDEYEINDEWYTSISAIKGDYLYIWSTEFTSAGNVIPRKIYIPTDTTNLQDEITANTTRINNVERVIVLDVSNGMSSTHFNTIFNDFKNKNYKYVLKVDSYEDYFNICSVQDTNRSITAIGFDGYEEQMMCYTWFQPQPDATPELTKRQITTEII